MKYMVFFEMQQAPLQVRPENTFATKATRGYTETARGVLHTDSRPLACPVADCNSGHDAIMMLTFIDITKQKTSTRLPP